MLVLFLVILLNFCCCCYYFFLYFTMFPSITCFLYALTAFFSFGLVASFVCSLTHTLTLKSTAGYGKHTNTWTHTYTLVPHHSSSSSSSSKHTIMQQQTPPINIPKEMKFTQVIGTFSSEIAHNNYSKTEFHTQNFCIFFFCIGYGFALRVKTEFLS